MVKYQKPCRLSEAKVKLSLGDWLGNLGFKIFDEKENKERPQWGVFEVRNINRGKRPDLVVQGNLSAAQTLIRNAYVAVEIKRGYKHHDILDGFDEILEYLSDYLWGAEYRIHDKPIEITSFVFATFFSKEGFLFQEEGKFDFKVVRGPWDAHPMTFTIARLLWRQKDNLVRRFQHMSGIPKVERRLKGKLFSDRYIPEIGVLVRHLSRERNILLMLSRHPFHWKFKGRN